MKNQPKAPRRALPCRIKGENHEKLDRQRHGKPAEGPGQGLRNGTRRTGAAAPAVAGAVKAPTFATRPAAPPATSPASNPSSPAGNAGLGGLREEMLKELERLKKIMRGT